MRTAIRPLLLGLAFAGAACRANDAPSLTGTVEATDALLGFAAPGRIAEIAVREGDRVERGQVLARLDTAEAGARRAQAVAQEAAARAALLELEHGSRAEELANARAAEAGARDALVDAERDLARYRDLAARQVVSRQAYDKLQVAYDVARSRHDQAVAQLRLVEAGPRSERVEAQRAQVATAAAQVRALEATLEHMMIRAPFAGRVTVRHREPGEAVAAGAPVLTVMDPADRWVRVFVPETRLPTLHLRDRVTIRTDAPASREYQGEVAWVSDEAEFTPRNVQTPEERVKLVYAAKVRIAGDTAVDLKPGMPATVTLRPAP